MTVSLCLPATGFTTGVALPVDGGLTSQERLRAAEACDG